LLKPLFRNRQSRRICVATAVDLASIWSKVRSSAKPRAHQEARALAEDHADVLNRYPLPAGLTLRPRQETDTLGLGVLAMGVFSHGSPDLQSRLPPVLAR
jgi:hypothetical protein